MVEEMGDSHHPVGFHHEEGSPGSWVCHPSALFEVEEEVVQGEAS
jgi:hypothetical protein